MNKRHASGVSLIELMIVVSLFGIIGVITSRLFIQTIRSLTISEIIKEVKQSGDFAQSTMEFMIRNADKIDMLGCNQTNDFITITNSDGKRTTFDCSDGLTISSVSADLSPLVPTVSLPLTSSKVRLSQCSFLMVCPTPASDRQYVFMTFTLKERNTVGVESVASEDFQSTVPLTNNTF